SIFAGKTQDFLILLLKNYENIKKHRLVTLNSVLDYSATLHSWSEIDEEHSSAFQFASVQIDTFQNALSKVEDDEELKLVGPAKEYISYSESVKSVVK
ncbi:hypothetical protein, partial [Salmonella sp. s54836]|uniref:hypothetical protein n=1 Tax=Salmonella sp. s54836 TaxID=3159673 RepID=UPI003980ED1A